MTITLVAAIDKNRGLGYKNQLLCKLPSDMRHFRELTLNTICIMGRNTYESIGSPLPERTNLVLSRDANYDPHPAVFVYSSIKDIIREYETYSDISEQVMILGGSSIYKQFLPYADSIELTVIHHEFDKVDAFFPEFSLDEFEVVNNVFNSKDNKNPYDYSFVSYKRKIK
ncbi:hypothetical protein BAOM_2935 [Peribacillus asahii]|uniref:Dihydrofolate reductase n=1 Tax=Peribacillus asahii TaxID=228899 RepID=A0A3Q9RP35_9BACI|nr:dihydrofolate reductase [Peribacillus asahii]AZV43544.1 hypothetical protein BAOM_2935 [Peribacillus asahii]